jgi:FixJ family two-component response regulator
MSSWDNPLADRPVIVIVDDDESVRTAVASLVRSLSHVACSFASAEEFLGSPRLDDAACLIVDQQMPGMSGVELQERLLSAGRRLPTIFITAHPEDRIRDRALAAGAVGFLGKPFAAQELIRCIDEALQRP